MVLCAQCILPGYKWSTNLKGKSTTRTLRIPKHLDEMIEKDSSSKRISVNALVSSLITKYSEWDRYVESLNFISIPTDGLGLLINCVEDDQIENIGKQIGSNHVQEFMMMWFKKISLDSLFEGLSIFCRYSGMASYDMEIIDNREYVVTMHHRLGRKWSIFIESILKEGIKKTLGLSPVFENTESSIAFRLPYV